MLMCFCTAAIFAAVSPHYLILYWRSEHRVGWEVLSGVLLCITGVEAMYADLGHFSRRAVQVGGHGPRSTFFMYSVPDSVALSLTWVLVSISCSWPLLLALLYPIKSIIRHAGIADTMRPVGLARMHHRPSKQLLCLQLSFCCIVYPAVLITYLGQAAFLWHNPESVSNTFYDAIPNPVYWPMFVISILAAIVASQVCIFLYKPA